MDKKIYKRIVNLIGKQSIAVDRQLVLADGKNDDDFKECTGYTRMAVRTMKNIFTSHQKQNVNLSPFFYTTRKKLSKLAHCIQTGVCVFCNKTYTII